MRLSVRAPPSVRWQNGRIDTATALRAWGAHGAGWIVLSTIASLWVGLTEHLLNPWNPNAPPRPVLELFQVQAYTWLLASLFVYYCIVVAGRMLDAGERLAAQRTASADLARQLAQAQLDALRQQIKPYADARFGLALARAEEQVAQARAARGAAAAPTRLAVRSGRPVHFVALADVAWVESADYCVDLHVAERTHSLRRSMASIEAELEPAGFCRVHRTAIVNLSHVRALEGGPDGEAEVLLHDGQRLPTSRRYRAALQERLGLRTR